MSASKYFGLSANTTPSSTAGQMWYDTGTIKYYDGTSVRSLGVAGSGISLLNGLSTTAQFFVVATTGTDFTVSSTGSAHTFSIPSASAANRGLLSTTDWSTFNAKAYIANQLKCSATGNSVNGYEFFNGYFSPIFNSVNSTFNFIKNLHCVGPQGEQLRIERKSVKFDITSENKIMNLEVKIIPE